MLSETYAHRLGVLIADYTLLQDRSVEYVGYCLPIDGSNNE